MRASSTISAFRGASFWLPAALLALLPICLWSDQAFQLGPGEYRWVPFTVRQAPTEIELRYEVLRGSPTVHVEILAIDEFRRFDRGKPHEVIASTENGKAEAFRKLIYVRGEYAVVLANAPRTAPATVSLSIQVNASPQGSIGTELSGGKRAVIVVLSLLTLAGTAWWSGTKLLSAMRRNRWYQLGGR